MFSLGFSSLACVLVFDVFPSPLKEKNVCISSNRILPTYVFELNGGTNHGNNDTQANKESPLLSEEVPYQITLIGLIKGVWIGGGGRKSSGG